MSKKITLQSKVQTVYYENSSGNIKKYYHAGNERITQTQAKKILKENGIDVTIVLRVLTEKVFFQINQDDFNESVLHSEKFYQQTKK